MNLRNTLGNVRLSMGDGRLLTIMVCFLLAAACVPSISALKKEQYTKITCYEKAYEGDVLPSHELAKMLPYESLNRFTIHHIDNRIVNSGAPCIYYILPGRHTVSNVEFEAKAGRVYQLHDTYTPHSSSTTFETDSWGRQVMTTTTTYYRGKTDPAGIYSFCDEYYDGLRSQINSIADKKEISEIALGDYDYDRRRLAAPRLKDQAVLIKIALNDRSAAVREAATLQLTDHALLSRIVREDKNPQVVGMAAALLEQLSNRSALPGKTITETADLIYQELKRVDAEYNSARGTDIKIDGRNVVLNHISYDQRYNFDLRNMNAEVWFNDVRSKYELNLYCDGLDTCIEFSIHGKKEYRYKVPQILDSKDIRDIVYAYKLFEHAIELSKH